MYLSTGKTRSKAFPQCNDGIPVHTEGEWCRLKGKDYAAIICHVSQCLSNQKRILVRLKGLKHRLRSVFAIGRCCRFRFVCSLHHCCLFSEWVHCTRYEYQVPVTSTSKNTTWDFRRIPNSNLSDFKTGATAQRLDKADVFHTTTGSSVDTGVLGVLYTPSTQCTQRQQVYDIHIY